MLRLRLRVSHRIIRFLRVLVVELIARLLALVLIALELIVLVVVFVFVEIEFILVKVVLLTGEHEHRQVGLRARRQLSVEAVEIAVAAQQTVPRTQRAELFQLAIVRAAEAVDRYEQRFGYELQLVGAGAFQVCRLNQGRCAAEQ